MGKKNINQNFEANLRIISNTYICIIHFALSVFRDHLYIRDLRVICLLNFDNNVLLKIESRDAQKIYQYTQLREKK